MDTINIDLARKLIKKQAVVLDIRTDKEYCTYHLCGSMHIPTKLPPLSRQHIKRLAQNLTNTLSSLNIRKTHPIIVYCKKGIRAGIAKEILEIAGYRNVHSLGGTETDPLKSYIRNPKYPEIMPCKCINS
jgi:phage shock protein E